MTKGFLATDERSVFGRVRVWVSEEGLSECESVLCLSERLSECFVFLKTCLKVFEILRF